jgi:hypothetical protein
VRARTSLRVVAERERLDVRGGEMKKNHEKGREELEERNELFWRVASDEETANEKTKSLLPVDTQMVTDS